MNRHSRLRLRFANKIVVQTGEKRRGKLRKGVVLRHDNAPEDMAHQAVQKAQQRDFEIVPHPT